jgi:hypothetical protein
MQTYVWTIDVLSRLGIVTAACRAMGSRGESIFWIFNLLQLAIDWQNNFMTKVRKVFFFIFMSSYAEMSFLRDKKITKYSPNFFF